MRKIFLIFLIILCGAVLSACASHAAAVGHMAGPQILEPIGFVDPHADISTCFVTRGPMEQISMRSGAVRVAWEPLFFETHGWVYEVYAMPGASVVAGQLLARLDSDAIAERIENQEEFIANRTRFRQLETERFMISMTMMQLDGADDAQMDRAEILHNHEMDILNRDINNARRYLQELRRDMAQTELRAPAAGIITHDTWYGRFLNTEISAMYLSPSQDIFVEYLGVNLFILPRAPRIEAHIEGRVHELIYTPMATEFEIAFRIHEGQPVDWRFEILPADGHMPGLGAYASILFYTVDIPDALRAPVNALTVLPEGSFIYRMENGEPVRTLVQVGDRTDTFVQILDGLEEGDEIVVR
ncbi:MAG: hypothetical protein FWB91_05505 [Defluviitaleaceae bacterium]|nr:hypothetical protein [Defluviitaleaceae bacterium]